MKPAAASHPCEVSREARNDLPRRGCGPAGRCVLEVGRVGELVEPRAVGVNDPKVLLPAALFEVHVRDHERARSASRRVRCRLFTLTLA